MLLHRHRTAARTAAAVRRGERLVQVQVHHVDAEIAGPRNAHQRVHVRAIHVHQRALGVQDLRRLDDVALRRRPACWDWSPSAPRHLQSTDARQRLQIHHAVLVRADVLAPRSRRLPRSPDWCRAPNRESESSCADCPAASSNARTSRMPVSSPCAPAAGCSVIASMPVISSSAASSARHHFHARPARAIPADTDAPTPGLRSAPPAH